ncbi:MAG: alpha-1,3-galactosidase-related protein [Flavisolibacter sp.]
MVILLLLFNVSNSFSQTRINLTDFGLTKNSPSNAATAIQAAIKACSRKTNAILVLPGGRIDVWPEESFKRELYISNCTEDDTLSKEKHIAFLFDHCKNLTLEGNNTLVMLHGKMVSFAILNSTNIRIKNISFDYDRPTMSEMKISSVSPNAIEMAIHPDSKYSIDSGRIRFYGEGWRTRSYHTILFDSVSNRLTYASFAPFLRSRAVELRPNTVRFEGDFAAENYKPGNILTVRDPYRDNCGAFVSLSKNVALENINMYYMHGLGIVSQFSENISLFKVRAAPPQNSGRVMAAFADCFHFSGCKGAVLIDSCYTSGSHDDPINVHGTYLKITGVKSNTVTVRFMHHQTWGFNAFFRDDSVAIIDPQTLLIVARTKLIKATLVNKHEMLLETEAKLPQGYAGFCIENLTWYPEVTIRNSRFERTNTRGILITTRRRALRENNVFAATGMYPILVADDASSWYESGAVTDLTIINNVFDNCGYNSESGAITILPENKILVNNQAVHRSISITGNTFKINNGSVLNARSVDHLLFQNNKIIYLDSVVGKNYQPVASFLACKNVKLLNNSFSSNTRPSILESKMNKTDLSTDINISQVDQ